MAGPSAASRIGKSVMPQSSRNFGRQVPPPSRISRSLTYWGLPGRRFGEGPVATFPGNQTVTWACHDGGPVDPPACSLTRYYCGLISDVKSEGPTLCRPSPRNVGGLVLFHDLKPSRTSFSCQLHINMHQSNVATHPTIISSGGSNMATPHNSRAVDVDEYQKLNNILSLLFPSTVHVQQSQNINARVHTLRLLTLSNGGRLLLKGSPLPGTPLLRHERFFLETEARFLVLLGQSANPCIPQLYHYDPRGALLGSAYLVRQYIKGRSLTEMQHQINVQQGNDIDRHLGFLASTIGQNVAPSFGSLQQVAIGAGKRSWREAFCALFESVLRDAEDIFIHLPYAEIRHEVARLSSALAEVTLPRLVVVGFGRPCHVLLDEDSHQLSGVVDFSSAFWGDVLMAEIFDGPTPAVLQGAGLPLSRTKGEEIRLLMYSCYRLVSQITLQYYRNRDEATEFDARRRLLATITDLVGLEPI